MNKLFKFPPLSNTDNMQFSYKINKLSLSMSNKAVLNAKLKKIAGHLGDEIQVPFVWDYPGVQVPKETFIHSHP